MTSKPIECAQCGASNYKLMDAKTGEVMCDFCRSHWVVPELIQKSETEKYLEDMAARPVVQVDNTTETDQNLMRMIGGLLNPLAAISRAAKWFIGIVIGVVVILIIMSILFKTVIQI